MSKEEIVDFLDECLKKWWEKVKKVKNTEHSRWLINMIARAYYLKYGLINGDNDK